MEIVVGEEAALHAWASDGGAERNEAHGLMVGHGGADQRRGAVCGKAARGEVDGLDKAVVLEPAVGGHQAEIAGGCDGVDEEGECGRIGRDDEVVGKAAGEAEPGDAEGPVLVGACGIGGMVAGLGDAPGQAEVSAIGHLAGDDAAVGLIEERLAEGGHDQQRHEVLEHGAAPAQEHGPAGRDGEAAAESEPVLEGELALGDGDEAGEAGLGGEQVVEALFAPVVIDPVAERKQPALAVVEEAEVGGCEAGAAEAEFGGHGPLLTCGVNGWLKLIGELRRQRSDRDQALEVLRQRG